MFSFLLKCQEAPEAVAHPDSALRRQSKESQMEPPAPISLSHSGVEATRFPPTALELGGGDGHHGFRPKSERSPEE